MLDEPSVSATWELTQPIFTTSVCGPGAREKNVFGNSSVGTRVSVTGMHVSIERWTWQRSRNAGCGSAKKRNGKAGCFEPSDARIIGHTKHVALYFNTEPIFSPQGGKNVHSLTTS